MCDCESLVMDKDNSNAFRVGKMLVSARGCSNSH